MDYLQLVKEKKIEMSELRARMDGDRDLLYLTKYVVGDAKGRPIPDIVNVTLSKLAVFAGNVIASMNGTARQTVVEASKKSIDTHYIEEFQDAFFAQAELKLQKGGGVSLSDFGDTQLCLRGRTAARVLCQMKEEHLVIDIRPWDTYSVFYEMGEEDLVWGAYETRRSRALIEREYGVTINGQFAEVLDVWDDKHNEVWVESKKVFEQLHSFGYPPIVVAVVPLGYGGILLGYQGNGTPGVPSTLKYEGESIFFLARGIIPEVNRLVSILQTLNLKAIKPPIKQKKIGGGEATPYEDVMGSGAATAMEPTEDIQLVDYGDARRAAMMLYPILDKALQDATLTSIELGNLQFPLSAVALVELREGKNQILLPRLSTKAFIYRSIAEMVTKQILAIGGTVELGTPGHKRSFDTSKLEGEYETSYKFFTKSPKDDIARLAMASQAKDFYTRRQIYTDILQEEDPAGAETEWYREMAEKIDPNILRHRVLMKLIELEEKGDEQAGYEALIMAQGMGVSLEALKRGELKSSAQPELGPPAQPIMPLLGEGGSIGGIPSSAQKAAFLQGTPREMVE